MESRRILSQPGQSGMSVPTEDNDSFFLPSGLIGDDNEQSSGRRPGEFGSQSFSSFSGSPAPSHSPSWNQKSLYTPPSYSNPSQASPFSSVPQKWQTHNSWTSPTHSPSSHFGNTQNNIPQPNPNPFQQQHSAYDRHSPSFFGTNSNREYANYAYQGSTSHSYQQRDAFSSMISYVAPAPSIQDYTTSKQQHVPLQTPQRPQYQEQGPQRQNRPLQPFMMPEGNSKNSSLYGGSIETIPSSKNIRKNASSSSGTNKWENRKNRSKSNVKPSITILERGGRKYSGESHTSSTSSWKGDTTKEKSRDRSRSKQKNVEGRIQPAETSKPIFSASADSIPPVLNTTKNTKKRKTRNKKGSDLAPPKISGPSKSKEEPSQLSVLPYSTSTPLFIPSIIPGSSIQASSSEPSLLSFSDDVDVPLESSTPIIQEKTKNEETTLKEEDTKPLRRELDFFVEKSPSLPPTPIAELQTETLHTNDLNLNSEINEECTRMVNVEETRKEEELATTLPHLSPRFVENHDMDKDEASENIIVNEEDLSEESSGEEKSTPAAVSDAESEEDEVSIYQQTISSIGALKKTWMIGFSSLLQILLYFLGPILSIHNSALNVISLYHVAFTVIYVYAFPFIVLTFQGGDAGASSASLVWYTFLVWFFINKGSISPSSSVNFRLFLPLLFVFEGVCNPRSIIAWNGGERLVLAFVLLSMKTNFFHWTCFFSLAALIVTSVFLGTNILVQWAILVIALSSLSPSFTLNPLIKEKMKETDDLDDCDVFSPEDHTIYNPSFEANLLPPSTSVGFYSTGNWSKSKKKKRKRF